MATSPDMIASADAQILSRLIRPDGEDLSEPAARALLEFHFDKPDLDRIHDLVTRNQDDALTATERLELESYLRVSALVDLVQAWARRSLKQRS